jgi:tetratricopeptide (TPR) repeat protein
MEEREATLKVSEAVRAGKERDYEKCISILLQVYAENGDVHDASLYLGRAYHALKKYESAISYLREYHRRKPGSVAGMFFLGRAYYCAGFPKEALFQLKRALKGSPESFQIKSYLAFAYFKSGRHDIALPIFADLVAKQPANSRIFQAYLNTLYVQAIRSFHRGEVSEAMEMFSFLHEQGVESVLLFLYLGMGAREEGRLHDALWAYEKALALSPEDELIRYRRAVLLKELGRHREAMEELSSLENFESDAGNLDPLLADYQLAIRNYEEENYRKAAYYGLRMIKAGDKESDTRLLVGESFRRIGEFSRAENHFRRVLDLDRTRLEARYGIAMVMWQTGRFRELLNVLRQIEHSDPENEIALYYTALAWWKLKEEPLEAGKMALQALEKNKDDPYLLTALGDFSCLTGDEEDAERWYRKAISVKPDFLEALSGIIALHEKRSEDPAVRRDLAGEYELIIPLLNNSLEVMKKRMVLLYHLEDYIRCAEQARKVLSILPGDRQSLRVLGISLRKTGRYFDAALAYRSLLSDDPFNERFIISYSYCLEKSGKGIQAAQFMEQAVGAMKSPAYKLLLIWGMLYYNSGNYEESSKVFRRAIQHTPEAWQAYLNLGMSLKQLNQPDLAERYLAMSKERS